VRVLHVSPSVSIHYGGPSASLWGYVRASIGSGVDVSIAAPWCAPTDRSLPQELAETPLHLFRSYGRAALVTSPALIRWLRRSASEYDVIHVHGLFNPISSTAPRVAARQAVPYVVRPFGTLSRYTFEHRRSALKHLSFRLIEFPNLMRAGGLHFTSEGERREARSYLRGRSLREFVIPPPWVGSSQPISREPDAAPVVLFLGRIHAVKGIDDLLRAWPRALQEVPGARLVIAGDGDPQYLAAMRTLAAQLAPGARVEFAGFANATQKAVLLRRASLFVLPSHHENFGIAVVEALAAGVPVVVTPEVQLAEFVREHRLGLISDREPSPLGHAIARALQDHELRTRCGRCAGAILRHSFSPARIGDQQLRMYE
jgi:glycosyltransferase involved in cell wall biosynthesis